MALIIRLRQQGRNNRRSFRLVVADKRSPRDGKYVEKLGWYDPFLEKEVNYEINAGRVQYWLDLGAEISDKAKMLVAKTAPEMIKALHDKRQKKKKKTSKKKEASPKEHLPKKSSKKTTAKSS